MKRRRLLIIHGPNLNLLGEREPEIYGSMTLRQLNQRIKNHAQKKRMICYFFQTNYEGKIIELLHTYRKKIDGVVLNPGAYTHYSYAIRDAVESIQVPCVEVHLSDIKRREKFRRKSVITPVCRAQFYGRKVHSYLEALDFLADC